MAGLTFTNPLLLLGLLALPVIWWLLRATPPAAVRVPFGATIFLEHLKDVSQSPARTPWWILLLRLGMLALIIIGLAGPIFDTDREGIGEGSLLVMVDDTWPAAATWTQRQEIVSAFRAAPGADQRIVRVVTATSDAELTDPISLPEAVSLISGMQPQAKEADRLAQLEAFGEIDLSEFDVYWLSDGTIGRRGADRTFLQRLGDAQSLVVFQTTGQGSLGITDVSPNADGLSVSINRIGRFVSSGTIVATARDGRALGTASFEFAAGTDTTSTLLTAPLELRNEISRLSIVGERTAGATWFADAGYRRIRAGLVSDASASLLDGGFYLQKALSPHADILQGDVEELAVPEVGMIVLDDIGTLRVSDKTALVGWIENGGVLLRFAGPNTANAQTVTEGDLSPTFPAPLRGTQRAFGGALTWETVQTVDGFDAEGPLSDITLEDPIGVRRQILTRTNVAPDVEVWARLSDGTPIVTARPSGRGLIILVHVTAAPTWSDLPVSSAFPDMIERITRFAAGTPADIPDRPLSPYRISDGFGQLVVPAVTTPNARLDQIRSGEAIPGLYGDPNSAVAANTWVAGAPTLDPLSASLLPIGTRFRGTQTENAKAIGPALIAAALILFLLDAVAMMLTHRAAKTSVTAGFGLILASSIGAGDAFAQALEFRPPISEKAINATLTVRFAYVETGDRTVDRLSQAGLYGISRETRRRTALEPADPDPINIETDDLSVYPMIYWPIVEGAQAPSDGALSRLERFMAGGGLLIVDTRDGELRGNNGQTPTGRAAQLILRRMNIPPLEPVTEGHILTRSFYLLDDLPGRNRGGNVWVDAQSALSQFNDGVPSLIIGGRDWASAWAMDAGGIPLRPPGSDGERGREIAIRSGINFAMVALTGNYKGDQVHVQEMLDRLGEDNFTP